MAEATIALGEEVAALKPRAIDEFSRWAIEGAERALADGENPLRLNFFFDCDAHPVRAHDGNAVAA